MSDKARPRCTSPAAATSIADGAWHALECRRSGADAVHPGRRPGARRASAIPATLSVVTAQPLSIGGKGVGADNDQFHGSVDDVWIRVD